MVEWTLRRTAVPATGVRSPKLSDPLREDHLHGCDPRPLTPPPGRRRLPAGPPGWSPAVPAAPTSRRPTGVAASSPASWPCWADRRPLRLAPPARPTRPTSPVRPRRLRQRPGPSRWSSSPATRCGPSPRRVRPSGDIRPLVDQLVAVRIGLPAGTASTIPGCAPDRRAGRHQRRRAAPASRLADGVPVAIPASERRATVGTAVGVPVAISPAREAPQPSAPACRSPSAGEQAPADRRPRSQQCRSPSARRPP